MQTQDGACQSWLSEDCAAGRIRIHVTFLTGAFPRFDLFSAVPYPDGAGCRNRAGAWSHSKKLAACRHNASKNLLEER